MRSVICVLAVALVLTALSCGGDDDDASTTATSTTSTSAAPSSTTAASSPSTTEPTSEAADDGGGDTGGSGDACAYLSADAVSEALGADYEVQSAGEQACVFSSSDDAGPTVSLNRTDILIDPGQYADEARDSCDEGSIVEVDAGDTAYACLVAGPSGSYYQGDVVINLSTLFADSDQEQDVLDAFVELLPQISVPG